MMMDQRNELEAEITSRWEADAKSTGFSNVRPSIVLMLAITLMIFIILTAWIWPSPSGKPDQLYEVLTLTAVGGYFILRSVVDKRLKP